MSTPMLHTNVFMYTLHTHYMLTLHTHTSYGLCSPPSQVFSFSQRRSDDLDARGQNSVCVYACQCVSCVCEPECVSCVCIHVSVCLVCVCVCLCVRVSVSVYWYVYIKMCVYTCVYVFKFICLNPYML